MSYTDRKDTNWILNSVYNSGGTFTTRLDTNDILNLIYDESGALKVNITNLPSGATGTICNVGPGTNILTAGTSTFQVVSTVESPNFNNITASGTCEAAVYTSGGTDLYGIFLTSAQAADITRVQPGTNITTGGTANEPIVNLVDSPSVNGITASGTCEAAVYTSGGTDLYSIFLTAEAHVGDVVSVAAGDANIEIGGTGANPTVELADNVNVVNLSATTFYSGSTELSTLFGTGSGAVNSVTAGDANIEIGGTAADPTVSLADSPSVNNITASGTCEAAVYTSGGTDLYGIFLTSAQAADITRVQPGTNTYTGGTANEPTINISAATLDNLTVSGTSSFGVISATTFYSGSTELSTLLGDVTPAGLDKEVQFNDGGVLGAHDYLKFSKTLGTLLIGYNTFGSVNNQSWCLVVGERNYTDQAANCFVNGQDNFVRGRYSTCLGAYNRTADDSFGAGFYGNYSLVRGLRTNTYIDYMEAIGCGQLVNNYNTQHCSVPVQIITTDNSLGYLVAGDLGNGRYLTIREKTIYKAKASIVAFTSNYKTATWNADFNIKRVSNTSTLVYSNVTNTFDEIGSGTTLSIGVDDTNDRMLITASGVTDTTIYWKGFIEWEEIQLS